LVYLCNIKQRQKQNAMKTKLQNIYKANQCSDINDVQIAIEQVKELAHTYGWTPALRNRYVSLEKKRIKLMPQMHPIFTEIFKIFGIK
jgi:hypothetical protein